MTESEKRMKMFSALKKMETEEPPESLVNAVYPRFLAPRPDDGEVDEDALYEQARDLGYFD